jgi:hypothetical protein
MDQWFVRNLLRGKRLVPRIACCAFLSSAVAISASTPVNAASLSAAEVDQSVLALLSHQGVTRSTVISHLDLTKPFATATQWTLVIVQDDAPPPSDSPVQEDHGRLFVCLVKSSTPDCAQHLYRPTPDLDAEFSTPYHLLADRVVDPNRDESTPLLLVKLCSAVSVNSDCMVATALYRYDRAADRFVRVFLNVTGRNNNQETRFVDRGPLQGDVIVDYPTQHPPYTYWIVLYAPGKSGRYGQVLRYRGHTGYGDGNPLAVPDSEMPEILRRLGLWHPGDALPRPSRLPSGCTHLLVRQGEEWCH